jgi:energy-coupling factor transporter transmembrane protein EcfT
VNHLVLMVLFVVVGTVLQGVKKVGRRTVSLWAPFGAWFVALLVFLSTSFVIIEQDKIGHRKRVLFAADIQPGQIIEFKGQKGPQADILGPGFHLIALVNILFEIEQFPVVEIPKGSYGLLTAKDGAPLRSGEYMAKGWSYAEFDGLLNAERFLKEGGQKGPQLNVLCPGTYRINFYLFDVKRHTALNVKAGEVAVIKSNVQERTDCPSSEETAHLVKATSGSAMSVTLVPKGCTGV